MLSLAGKCRVFLRGKQEVAYHTRRLLLLLSKRKHAKNKKTRAEPRRKAQDIFTREARASVHTRRLLLSKRKHAKHEQTRATSNVNRRTWAHQTTTMEGNHAGSNSTNDYSSYREILYGSFCWWERETECHRRQSKEVNKVRQLNRRHIADETNLKLLYSSLDHAASPRGQRT